MTLNTDILASDAPAAFEVDYVLIEGAAVVFAALLSTFGSAHVVVEPDDGTHYEFMAARNRSDRWSAPWVVASNFGCAWPWNGTPTIHPDYATEHYVANHNPWTGTVTALFLNAAAERLS